MEDLDFDGHKGGNGGPECAKLWSMVLLRGWVSLMVQPPLVFTISLEIGDGEEDGMLVSSPV